MSDPVTNIQIEDVLASIRRLVSEEVRAQTQGDDEAPAAQSPFRKAEDAAQPAPEQKAEKLILAPHLRVAADAEPTAPQPEDIQGEAPFTEVGPEEAAAFQEDAQIFHGFGAEPPAFEDSDEDPLRQEATAPHSAEAAAFDAGEDAPLSDFDAVLRALEMGSSEPQDDDFANYGDGAAEALASAHHSATEDEGPYAEGPYAESPDAESPEDEDARFDDLDAVLSTLEFDPEPMVSPMARAARTEIEDAEILEDEATDDSLERMFASPEPQAEDPEAIVEPEPLPKAETGAADLVEDSTPEALQPDGDATADMTSDLTDDPLAAAQEAEELLSFGSDDMAEDDPEAPKGDEAEGLLLDEQILRDMVSEIVRQELQGALGERITRNVRKLVRREIQRALQSQDYI